MGGKGDRPSIENRWWVDQTKDEHGRPIDRPPPQFGQRFFQTAAGFQQDRAQRRLTDLNLKWFEEARPEPGSWALVRTLEKDRVSAQRLEKVKSVLRLPPGGRGVLVDSGDSVRAIITGDPVGERLVEVRFGEESSFDAWVHGEWVREVLFRDFDECMRRTPSLLREYLTTSRATPLA
jgi:hypothetical protein